MKDDLEKSKCEPCNKLTPKLNMMDAAVLLGNLYGWYFDEKHHLQKKWKIKDPVALKKFVDAIWKLAENEGHHPNINFTWGVVEVTIWTHAIDGLSRNDFILAAKIDSLPVPAL
jgi:4a-hydroxytetrahydrobiopterin dehydratase